MIKIYIDTNYKGLKGKGEYGYYLEWEKDSEIKRTLGPDILTIEDTRNRAFLKVAIEAIGRIAIKDPVKVYAACDYLVSSMSKRLPEFWFWQNWVKGNGDRVSNCDLWQELLQVIKEKEIPDMEWIGGHHEHTEKIIRAIEKQYEKKTAPL